LGGSGALDISEIASDDQSFLAEAIDGIFRRPKGETQGTAAQILVSDQGALRFDSSLFQFPASSDVWELSHEATLTGKSACDSVALPMLPAPIVLPQLIWRTKNQSIGLHTNVLSRNVMSFCV